MSKPKPLEIVFPTEKLRLMRLLKRVLKFGDEESKVNKWFKFNRKINVNYYRVEARLVNPPKTISFRQPENVVLLSAELSGSKAARALQNLHIETPEYPITVHFDPCQIEDYSGESEIVELSFQIVYVPQEGNAEAVKREEFSLMLKFQRTELTADWRFAISNDFKEGLHYSPSRRKELLGAIRLKTKSKYSFVHPLDGRIRLNSPGFNDAIFFRDVDESRSGGQPVISFSNLPANKSIEIPVYVDLKKIKAPHEIRHGDIEAVLETKKNGQYVPDEKKTGRFSIKPDPQKAELEVEILFSGEKLKPNEANEYIVPQQLVWSPNKKGGSRVIWAYDRK